MRANIAWLCLTALGIVALSSGVAAASVTAVPEPGSLGLLAAGLAGAAWIRFRRRR